MEDIFNAIRNGQAGVVRNLLATNKDLLHVRDQRGSTPLILAAYYNQIEIVELLLEIGVDVDDQDPSGNTALMGVCFKGFEKVARKLIAAGANVDARNSMGASCLIFAITFNHEDIAKLLIEKGADVHTRDARGKTALDHARMQGLNNLVGILENR